MIDAPQFLSIAEAAERLSVHPATLRQWIRLGLVIGRQMVPGGRILVPLSELERLEAEDDDE